MSEYIIKIETDMDGVEYYIKKGILTRCKDCKHNMDNGLDYSDNTLWCCMRVNPEGFCDQGERREDEYDKP